jgi:hypothetical protein
LTLSSSAKSSTRVPMFFEDDPISGVVFVTAEKGDSIQKLAITVVGKVVSGPSDPLVFLQMEYVLWRRPDQGSGEATEKIRGDCDFPFSFTLPRKISMDGSSACRPPQTFTERESRVSVQYELTVKLEKGRLRSDASLKTPIAYVPLSKPTAFSALRQLAYASPTVQTLPGPSVDPEGWCSFPPILFSSVPTSASRRLQSAQLLCQLSLASPLSYTRGSVLPISITFSPTHPVPSDDTIATLDLLSTPSTASSALVLRRHIRHRNKRSAWKEEVTDVTSAVFWRPRAERGRRYVEEGGERRTLEGEISLPKDLMPSVDLGSFVVSYEGVLKELIVRGVLCTRASGTATDAIWAQQTVAIAASYGKGPRPVAYAPRSNHTARMGGPPSRTSSNHTLTNHFGVGNIGAHYL